MRLLLIRHGQTPANVLGQLNTRKPGPGLTELGLTQAAAVPDALADETIGRIFATPLVRTQLTAHPLAERLGLDVTVLDGLREIEAGDLEDDSDRGSVEVYLSAALAWARGELDPRIPGGPDGHEFFERFDAAIAEVVASGAETAAVFSHGMAIRCWASARAANIEGSYAATHQLDNTGMVVLDSTGDEPWRLITWHTLPIGGQTLHDAAAVDPTGESMPGADEPMPASDGNLPS
ncbi:histidine phosphatase family protein [Leifsonia poae]|uniref:histidine phosphatase family protein n=1 Tax=Leifsonia poae TaxID=110933 RepID=UPI003D66E1F6